MKQAAAGTPYRVPPEPRRWSAIVLAVAMHALLLAFLVVGINWQNSKPSAVEAEVWDMKVQTAAPPPPPPPQEAEPQPEPEPAPQPKVVDAPPPPAPDIKLEQEKKRKEELKQKQLAEAQARKEEQARELAEKKEAEKKAREEQKAKELAEKKAEEKKAAEDKAKADKAAKARLAKLKAMSRQQELDRMMAQAGSGTSGSAARSTAPKLDSGYIAAITAKIKSNTIYPGSTDVPGNPTASFQVEQLPTGDILSVKMVKSSGVPSFDRAVQAGIEKSTPLPHKKDGTVERTLTVNFSMKDMH